MSAVGLRLAAPRAGLRPAVGGARTDPFTSFLDNLFEDSPGAKFEQQANAKLAETGAKIGLGISELIGMKPKSKAGEPTSPPPPKSNTGGSSDDKGKPERKIKGSDFRVPVKIAATGGAIAGAGFAVNEAAKQLGDTANDAVGTTGEAIQNAAEGIGKGFDNVGKSVGDALSPVLDPLGIKDPKTQSEIGKWLVIGGIVAIGLFVFVMVMRK